MYWEVSKIFYEHHTFPLDMDHDGNVWHLRSTADNPTHSKVLYHPSVIPKKRELIQVCRDSKNLKQVKLLDDAKRGIEHEQRL